VEESQDSNLRRPSRLEPLKKRYLKSAAVPFVFPNLASYLSKPAPMERSETSTSSARHQRAVDNLDQEVTQFFAADEISTLADLREKLDEQCLPQGVDVFYREDCAVFTFMTFADNCPTISASLVIQV
jgi:hypothetical protein